MSEWLPYEECQKCSVRLKCILGLEYNCIFIINKIHDLRYKQAVDGLDDEEKNELERLLKMPAGEGVKYGELWDDIKW